MHQAELMMALLIASTTLAGLTGVFMGQVAQALKQGRERARWGSTLLKSFGMFVCVIICMIFWFTLGNPWWVLAASCFFVLQIVAFTLVFFRFWSSEFRRQS